MLCFLLLVHELLTDCWEEGCRLQGEGYNCLQLTYKFSNCCLMCFSHCFFVLFCFVQLFLLFLLTLARWDSDSLSSCLFVFFPFLLTECASLLFSCWLCRGFGTDSHMLLLLCFRLCGEQLACQLVVSSLAISHFWFIAWRCQKTRMALRWWDFECCSLDNWVCSISPNVHMLCIQTACYIPIVPCEISGEDLTYLYIEH